MQGNGSGISRREVAIVASVTAVGVGVAAAGYYYFQSQKKQQKSLVTSSGSGPAKPAFSKPKALVLKDLGNDAFRHEKYDEAVQFYTSAIDEALRADNDQMRAHDLAAFYQNRAAAYEKLEDAQSVIDDCSKAIGLHRKYIKAIYRRAKAHYTVKNYEQAIVDFTAGCVLDNFQTPGKLEEADHAIRTLSEINAKRAFELRTEAVPLSSTFIDSYFSSFINDPCLPSRSPAVTNGHVENGISADTSGAGDSVLAQAHQYITEQRFDEATDLCHDSKDPVIVLLRATFALIRGQQKAALKDLGHIINHMAPEISDEVERKQILSNAYIKRGSLHMQHGRKEDALADFRNAETADPENADVYHHRGQLLVLLEDIDGAIRDLDRSVELAPNFDVSNVQRCYAMYRQAVAGQSEVDVRHAISDFEQCVNEQFPSSAEGAALLGQAYTEMQRFDDADRMYARAQKNLPSNANIYVHRGLLELQWHGDAETATKLIQKAIDVDPNCEYAYETLGTIELQRGNLDTAIGHFERSLKLARTELELGHLYSLYEAARMQSKVIEQYGVRVPSAS